MREYALVFAVAAAATYLLTPIVRRLAIMAGAMNHPRDRDVHAIPTPRLGGLAMYGGVAVAMVVAQRLPALRRGLAGTFEIKAVLVSGLVICLIGAIDDRWGMDAFTKLAGQVFSAGLMVLLGIQLLYIWVPGSDQVVLGPEAVPLTIILALCMINSINFIDGLDGLAAGVVAIAALALFFYSYELSVVFDVKRAQPATLISAVLAGVCIGFLPHNFNPARIFMGDSGSMLLGLMLAAATTSGTGGTIDYSALSAANVLALFFPLLIPVFVLAVPFVDLVLAIARRAMAGRPVFAPDKQHLHHRLLEIGHSHRRAVLIMYFWSALVAFGGVSMSVLERPEMVGLVVGAAALAAVLVMNVPRLRARLRP
jgi:UDP-GlcNAc:undecaprenyl-phosphate GlcNAc-1-phosphate transferase